MKHRILFVDLEREKIWKEEKDLSLFMGGKGLCTYLIYKNARPCEDPLLFSPAVIAAGALAYYAPASGKTCFGAVSPLTNLIHDSYAGEVFGPFMRMAGYEAIVILGRSERPVYLEVGEEVEIRNASDLWGLDAITVAKKLRKKNNYSVAAIGPAGERKVRYASIIVDGWRAAGRGGIGAVWGSKKLKAVVVKAEKPLPFKKELKRRVSELFKSLASRTPFAIYGTNNGLVTSNKLNMAPHYNFQKTSIDDVGELKGDIIVKRALKVWELDSHLFGYMCPLKCPKVLKVGEEMVKSEYEHLGMLGACDGIYKLDEVMKSVLMVNKLGLDSISTGNVIGWVMEARERGLKIYDISWGDAEKQRELMEKIAKREGVGAFLAEGVKRVSEMFGGEDWAVHVKGLEAPAWDPRGLQGFGLSYATADVGASHLRGWPKPFEPPNKPAKESVRSLIEDRDKGSIYDHMGLCRFVPYELNEIAELLNLAYDMNVTVEDLRKLSWRTESLARLWAIRAGYRREHDTVPKRWMEPSVIGTRAFLSWDDLEEAKTEYYKARGWSERHGIPLPETLRSLGLEEFVEHAEALLRELEG